MTLLLVTRDVPDWTFGSTAYKLTIVEGFCSRGIAVCYVLLASLGPDELAQAKSVCDSIGARLIPYDKSYGVSMADNQRISVGAERVWNRDGTAMLHDAPVSPAEEDFVRDTIEATCPDVTIVDYAWLCSLFNDQVDMGKRCVLTHDVIYERNEVFRKYGLPDDHANWSKEKEARLLKKADVIIAIQVEDGLRFRALCPESEIVVVPMSFPIRESKPSPTQRRCLFVGSSATHNVHGLSWFVSGVWPLVREKLPDATLSVCGTVCDGFNPQVPGVHLKGIVPSLDEEYESSSVCIAPLLVGSGLKLKVVEAMAHRRVCVTTSVGAQGLELIEGIVIVDQPQEFADTIEKLMLDDSARHVIESTAYSSFSGNFGRETYLNELLTLVAPK